MIRTRLRILAQTITGYRAHKYGSSYAFANTRRPASAWFSHMVTLRHVVEALHIDLVLDVGANEGQFGLNLREFYSGDLISFEPVSEAFSALTRTCSKDPRWSAIRLALGDSDGAANINVASATKFSSLLHANAFSRSRWSDAAQQVSTEEVRVARLDTVLHELVPDISHRRVLLKMDTQGYDQHVFNGVGRHLSRVFALQSELSLIAIYDNTPRWTACISAYEAAGFGIAGLFPVSWESGRVIEYDCVMIRDVSAKQESP